MSNPLVSIVVPIYNVEKYLRRCLDSILNQTYSNLEVILVNDGSTDKSISIIESFLEKDKRINFISQMNSGPSIARNRGIKEATGEFICFIDADDYVPNDYIYTLVDKISIGYDIVACGYIEISEYGCIQLNDFYQSTTNLQRDQFIDGIFRGVGGTLWAKIYRRSIIELNELNLNPDIYMFEDLLFNLDYCSYAQSFGSINSSLYEYNRLNEGSITSKIGLNYLENNIFVMQEIKQKLRKIGWINQKIDKLIKERIILLVLLIAVNESTNLTKLGITYCSSQLECLLNHSFVQKYFKDYRPKNQILDCGGYYLKKRQYRRSVISFYITERLRCLKLWVRKRGKI